MPPQIIKARVMNLVQTEAEWLIPDPVILLGEVAYVNNGSVVNMKLGDGVKKFSELSYNFDLNSGTPGAPGVNFPFGQVTRFRKFTDANGPIAINGLFDKHNSLSAIYVFKKSGGDFNLLVGTTAGESDLATIAISDDLTSLQKTELFSVSTNLHLTGFDVDHVCDVLVLYNSFQFDNDGNVLPDIIAELRAEIQTVADTLTQAIESLSNAMVQMPSGTVVQWNGGASNIPAGWHLYEGNKDCFVMGAGGDFIDGAPLGAKTVTLSTANLPETIIKTTVKASSISSWRVGGGSGKPLVGIGSFATTTEIENNEVELARFGASQAINITPKGVARIFIEKE